MPRENGSAEVDDKVIEISAEVSAAWRSGRAINLRTAKNLGVDHVFAKNPIRGSVLEDATLHRALPKILPV